MIILLLIIASGILGYEIVFSGLSSKVKQLLFLDKDYYPITAIQYPSIICTFIGKWKYILFPLIIPLTIVFKLHQWIRTLLKCPFCSSFWVGLLSTYFIIGSLPITLAIASGLCSMVACALYNLIRLKLLR